MVLPRRRFLAHSGALAVGLALRPARANPGNLSGALATAIDAAAAESLKAGASPGLAIRVASRGTTIFAKDYGLANLETGTAVTPDSVFRIGSLTKQFTAALILKLASDGKLLLDDAAAKFLPFFADKKLFTLRELLNHTAGLHSDESDASASPKTAEPKSQIALAREVSAQAMLFDFDPGTAWHYSNANYWVLGAVVEKVAGMKLAEAASALLFKPLGLRRTAFDTTDAVVPGRVDGYSPRPGQAGMFSHAPYLEIAETGGAGAMRSTTEELCRWHHALLSGQLFAPRWVETMLAPGRLRDGRVSGSKRFSAEDAHYGETQYAMGLLVTPPASGHRSVLHYGAIYGFASFLETHTDLGLTTVVLCNGDIGPAMPFRAVRRAVAAHVLKTPDK